MTDQNNAAQAAAKEICKAFELSYAMDADDPTNASDLSHFTNGWRACIMSQVRTEGVQAGDEPGTYVEARECGACGHVGINDSSDTQAACKNCDWSGDSPTQDHCPGCAQNGTMTAACPKCGSQYRLLADSTICAVLASAPVADSTLPLEQALYELVNKIDPGLDTGDLLQDARRASTMLDAIMTSGVRPASAPVAGKARPSQLEGPSNGGLIPEVRLRALALADTAPQASEAVRRQALHQAADLAESFGREAGAGHHFESSSYEAVVPAAAKEISKLIRTLADRAAPPADEDQSLRTQGGCDAH